jgi:periplasmic protein TonB
VRCIDPKMSVAVAAVAWLAGCSSPMPPASPPPARPSAGGAAAPPSAALPAPSRTSNATSEKAYRVDAARVIYAAYADSIFKGKLPPLLYAIAVVETEIDARGNVRAVRMLRAPSHAPEVTARVRDLIQKASPLPAPVRLGTVRYVDTWLVDKSGKFQLDTLTEGQL